MAGAVVDVVLVQLHADGAQHQAPLGQGVNLYLLVGR